MFTQQDMAVRLGMTESGYRAIETGRRDGTIETWRKIQKILQIPNEEVWEMMKGTKNGN